MAHDRRNPCLQGLRGAAAFAVLIYHIHYMSAKAGLTTASQNPLAQNTGPFAVLIFFGISGYLIIGSLLRHQDVRRFALNRVLRIYPLFLLLHLVMFSVGPVLGYEWMGRLRGDPWGWIAHFFSNLLFLPGLTALPIAQKNAWSLSYEAAFYLIAGALFIAVQRRHTWHGRCLLVLALLACWEAIAFESRLVFFGVGVLVWWLDDRKLIRWPSMGPLSLVCLLAGMFACSHEWYLTAAVAMLPVLMDIVQRKGWLSPALGSRTMGWLGQISYSLYLVHPFVLDPLRRLSLRLGEAFGPQIAHMSFVLMGVPVALAVAALAHQWIEVKLTRRLAAA